MLKKEKNGCVLSLPQTTEDLTQVIAEFKALKPGEFVGLDTETTGLDYYKDKIVGVCLAYKHLNSYRGFYLPVRHQDYDNLPLERVLKFTNWIIKRFQVVLFNRSYDFNMLDKEEYVEIDTNHSHDVQILCWEATYEKFPSLKKFYRTYCKKDIDSFAATVSKSRKESDESDTEENAHNFGETNPEHTFTYGAYDPVATLELFFKIQQLFPYVKVIYPLDNKVSEVLRHLTNTVYKIDYGVLRKFREEQDIILRKLQREIYDIAGYQFKINSNREKAEALSRFVTLTKKTSKGAFEVSIPVLEKIDHPLAQALVKYAETHKFINSYLDPLLNTEGTEVRINYKTCEAPTARIASGKSSGNSYYAPLNIQSIPSDKETLYIHRDSVLGFKATTEKEGALGEFETKSGVRKAFVAPEGYVFMTFDFASEELRITANMSKETSWIEAIRNGEDLHTATALQVFGKGDKSHRSKAKTINFGILYGMSVYSLRDRLQCTLDEAKQMLQRYHQRLVNLDRWIKSVQARGKKTMCTSTYYGRVRPLGQWYNSSDPKDRGFADRSAVNSAIQGCIPEGISFEGKGIAVQVNSEKNLRATYKTPYDNEMVLTHRGLNYCYCLVANNGQFIVCDRNHSLFTKKGKNLKVHNAMEAMEQGLRLETTPLQSKIRPSVKAILSKDKSALSKLHLRVKRNLETKKEKILSNLMWQAWLSNSTVDLNPVQAANLRSVCSVHGWDLRAELIDEDNPKLRCRLAFTRPRRARFSKWCSLGMLPVASATIRWGAPVYASQGFKNRNTAADILRIKLCELYQLWKTDKEFHDNVIICWSVHDEIEFYVKEEYRAKAFQIIPKVMRVEHENWQVPLVVEGGVGYSWGTCLDCDMDENGKIIRVHGAEWYGGKPPEGILE